MKSIIGSYALTLYLWRWQPKIGKRTNQQVANWPNCFGGKAGRITYPVLVGDLMITYTLYTTSKFVPKRVIAIGRSALVLQEQTLRMLDDGLSVWIDTALRGEYPWVLPVDIICGGRSQILSNR